MARVPPARESAGGENARVPLEWRQELSVGIEAIDAEHRQIVRCQRRLATAVIAGRPGEVRGALTLLQAYLAEHFVNEERWMAEWGYPAAGEHVRLHAALLDRVAFAREQTFGDPGALARAAAELEEGLDAHICTEDLKLARFCTARENLRLLAEAGPGVGVSLTPIPGSLPCARPARDEPPKRG